MGFEGMFGKNDEKSAVLAEHGRWIARMREDVRVMNQRLRGLERRLSTTEENLTELTKLYSKLDRAISRHDFELYCMRGRRTK
jgi:uncharacterized coiled-coil protein SlyX